VCRAVFARADAGSRWFIIGGDRKARCVSGFQQGHAPDDVTRRPEACVAARVPGWAALSKRRAIEVRTDTQTECRSLIRNDG
jgi:hypothetical protein